jgi:hypothetical protein
MRMRSIILAVGLAALAFGQAPAALADTVALSSITGTWSLAVTDPAGGATISNGSPTSTVSWGVPATASGQSAYQFTAVGGTVSFTVNPPPTSAVGLLGTFTHFNFPIFSPFLTSVELTITADIKVNSVDQGVHAFIFEFTHDETPNGGPPGGPFTGTCPFPTAGSPNGVGINVNGCADRVTITSNASSETFVVGGVAYTLDIAGFSQDGGLTSADQFLTIEDQTNVAGLYASVHAATQVPEPNSLALVGLAMLGVVGFLRRRSKR